MAKSAHRRINCFQLFIALAGMLIILSESGCKNRTTDREGPVIQINLPQEGSQIAFGSNIEISATIYDNEKLESIRISIINQENEAFLGQLVYTDAGKEKEISAAIHHDDIFLKSGIYYVKVVASDGVNETYAFRKIYLTEAPLQLKSAYIIRSNSTSTYIDTLGAAGPVNYKILPYSFTASAINSADNLLLIAEGTHLRILDAQSLEEISEFSYNLSAITSVAYDPDLRAFFSATVDGYLMKTDRYGHTSIYAQLPNQHIIDFLITDNYIFVFHKNFIQTESRVTLIQKSTSAVIQSAQLSFDLKKLLFKGDENKILAVGNESGVGVLKLYNRQTNFFNEVFSPYNSEVIYSGWLSSPERIILSHSNGLYEYNYSLQMVSAGVNLLPKKVVFEKLSEMNYAITESGVSVLNKNATQTLGNFPLSDCKDVVFLYNK